MATHPHSHPQHTPAPAPVPPPADAEERHSASEAPVRRADRVAFQIWVVCVLLTLVITLLLYLIDKLG